VGAWTTLVCSQCDKDLQHQTLKMQPAQGSMRFRMLPEVPEYLRGARGLSSDPRPRKGGEE